MAYHVQLESFEGPMDLLLQLVEAEKMTINQVSLAKVADQFMEYANTLTEKRPDELAEFLMVAAQLMLIKSKALLPHLMWDDDGSDAAELEQRLKMFQRFADAARRIDNIWRKEIWWHARTTLRAHKQAAPVFYPPPGVTASRLASVMHKLIALMEEEQVEEKESVSRIVSIRDKISYIRSRLYDNISIGFSSLIKDDGNRTELIVTFLALLELVKQKLVGLTQDTLFADINIRKQPDQAHDMTL